MPVLASTQQWGRDIKQALMKRALIAVLAFVVLGSALGQSPAKERKITLFVSRSVSPGKCKLELCKAADVFTRCAQRL
jgi:hypothetical protein